MPSLKVRRNCAYPDLHVISEMSSITADRASRSVSVAELAHRALIIIEMRASKKQANRE